ncbi:MAG: putative lipoprotein [Brevundimonas sp.]|jgi:putative lipoprotein|uniref:YbaY family lipoprotein n=1 Tax=Brevundimonas sp. TaxID=1871086 RepID=UPI0039E55B76
MRLNPLMLAPAGIVLALGACATVPADQAEVTGAAAYRERILLPPGHVLTVRLEDVSLADAPSRTLAEQVTPLEGRGPPYAFNLVYDPANIRDNHSYAVRAEIRDPDGRLRFTTDTRHSVITGGAPMSVDIMMVAVP